MVKGSRAGAQTVLRRVYAFVPKRGPLDRASTAYPARSCPLPQAYASATRPPHLQRSFQPRSAGIEKWMFHLDERIAAVLAVQTIVTNQSLV
jgi:hypothetical protein